MNKTTSSPTSTSCESKRKILESKKKNTRFEDHQNQKRVDDDKECCDRGGIEGAREGDDGQSGVRPTPMAAWVMGVLKELDVEVSYTNIIDDGEGPHDPISNGRDDATIVSTGADQGLLCHCLISVHLEVNRS